MLQIKLDENGKFVVTKFEAEHTHDLVHPSSSHVLRSQRTIEPSQAELYQLREKWAQVYGRSNFCAGMTTTQRSESINKYLKKFFSKNLILSEWVVQHERALVHRREKERLAEVATTQTKRNFLSNWKVEVQAAEMPGNPNLRRSLVYSPSNQSLDCSCKRFQFEGILCSHALKLIRELGLSTIPSKYYLKRWRRDARNGVDFQSYGEANLSDRSSSSVLQYSHLSHIAQRIVAKGAKDKQSCALVKSKLLELEAVLDSNSSIGQEHETNVDIDSCDEVNENNMNLVLRDPKTKKRRGRSKGIPTSEHAKISNFWCSRHSLTFSSCISTNNFWCSRHALTFSSCISTTTIPNQSLGYQVIRPMIYDYSVMYSQAITQPRLQGPARQLQFSDSSKS
ncbi:hypothetical protein M0R45_021999 [Rubus argutus]|uniref:Protein FAR1-RELATED SEQUENCE n=1 Tax=Rubus argutus TaxID=59490 RepID=A0AAW1XEP4_RUBAR